jgi:hypothetical protein
MEGHDSIGSTANNPGRLFPGCGFLSFRAFLAGFFLAMTGFKKKAAARCQFEIY